LFCLRLLDQLADYLTHCNQIKLSVLSSQILAVYDRFGRLMYGDPDQPRDVLEYVVLEKHIANEYGQWRIHGKIIPDWMPPRGALHKTYVKPEFDPLPDLEEEEEKNKKEESTPSEGSGLATAWWLVSWYTNVETRVGVEEISDTYSCKLQVFLTPSLPWCHLKMTSKSVKFENLKPFCFLFRTGMWKDFYQNT